MTKFFAGVLSVIAMGILLVAYGLLNLSASAFDPAREHGAIRPANERQRAHDAAGRSVRGALRLQRWIGRGGSVRLRAVHRTAGWVYPMDDVRPVRTVAMAPAPRRVVATQTVDRRPRRDWKKTALVIGGSTAGAAGLGAVFGGKKGALIGAAIGGGASTIYEATKR